MKITLRIAVIGLVLFIVINSCNKNISEGEKLAKTYCVSCHLFPEPGLLPKNVWQYSTLPYMGMMMGMDKEIENLPKELVDYTMLKPATNMLSNKEWKKIKEYYLSQSPKTLERPDYVELSELKNRFKVEKLDIALSNGILPNYTSVKIDKQKIIAGDQANRIIWILDQQGKLINKLENQDALANVTAYPNNKYIFTYIGYTTQANPLVNGSAKWVKMENKNVTQENFILKDLNRPLEVISENLDEDAAEEIISNEFGFKDGGLSIWKKNQKGGFDRKTISSQTGATKTIIKDFDNDGKKDILALCAQGDEKIILYINKGHLNFEEKLLLRFPSIYGSSSFDITDYNKDGKFDIVYTAGDNADFSTILKPYHGVYVYKNVGNLKFEQSHFFQQNGATKVIPGDFDNDGDVDLISIALFPDVEKRPQEGFIYFENTGKDFVEKTLAINHLGRWATADAGDIDNDGDLDIILGSHPVAKFPAGFDPEWKKSKGLLLLRNNTVKLNPIK